MPLRTTLTILVVAGMAILLLLPAKVSAAALPGLDDTCLETQLVDCAVLTSGYLHADYSPRIAFQTQAGFTPEDGVKGGVVLFEEGPDGWTLFASDFAGYRYDTPRLVEHDLTLLHVAGQTGGTGVYNTDLLFIRGDDSAASALGEWRPVDLQTWQSSIHRLLPEDREIWQGIDYDFDDWFYNQLNARTPLWRAQDGNCCPSGGWAIIHFTIAAQDVLVATGVDYLPPAKAK